MDNQLGVKPLASVGHSLKGQHALPPMQCRTFDKKVDELFAELSMKLKSVMREELFAATNVCLESVEHDSFYDCDVETLSCGPKDLRPEAAHSAPMASSTSVTITQIQDDDLSHAFQPRNSARSSESMDSACGSAPPRDLHSTESMIGSLLRQVSLERISTQRKTFVFLESSFAVAMWHVLNGALILLVFWSDTLFLAQDWNDQCTGPLGATFDLAALIVFASDILVHFNTAFEDISENLVVNRRAICKHYLKTWFFFDVLVTIPYDRLFVSADGRLGRVGRLAKLLRLIRCLKVASTFMSARNAGIVDQLDYTASQIFQFSEIQGCNFFATCGKYLQPILIYCAIVLFEAHIVCCILLGLSHSPSMGFTYEDAGVDKFDPWLRFFVVLRWSLVGCTTGSLDDRLLRFCAAHIDPQILQLCLALLSTFNLMWALYLHSYHRQARRGMHWEKLRSYFWKHPSITFASRQAVRRYHHAWSVHASDTTVLEWLKEVPEILKLRLGYERYAAVVREFHLFQQAPFSGSDDRQQFLYAICHVLTPKFFYAREPVVVRGFEFEGMHCTVWGRIAATTEETKDDAPHLELGLNASKSKVYQQQTFFGMSALFAPNFLKWRLSAQSLVAVRHSEVALLGRKEFDDAIKAHKEWSTLVGFVRSQVANYRIAPARLADEGLNQEMRLEYEAELRHRQRISLLAPEMVNEDLGVGATYLLTRFANDVTEEVGITNFEQTTFRDLGTVFWGDLEKYQGFKGCAKTTCPRDGLLGSSIVDALVDGERGRATHFVSWCWGYAVSTVVSGLHAWALERNADCSKTFFWVCFFCNNQRKVLIDGNGDDLTEIFAPRLQKVGHMIILFDTFDGNPLYTSRAWCIFEAFTATVNNIPVDMALPQESLEDFYSVLKAPGGFQCIKAVLTRIDVESSKASYMDDAQKIKDYIQGSCGFALVNRTVKNAFTKWLSRGFKAALRTNSFSLEPATLACI